MRRLAFFAALVLLGGCNSEGLPAGVGSPGLAGTGSDGGAVFSDGGGRLDLSQPPAGPDLGSVGAPCQTACDCQPGLACRRNGQCGMANFGGMSVSVYCCESPDCPQGSICQSEMSGRLSMCGGGPGPGGGGGGPGPGGGGGGTGYCSYLPCMSDSGCQQAGCGSCDPSTGTCQQ